MSRQTTPPTNAKRRKSISMHEDIPEWVDCCSCEAEPYWQALADEPDQEGEETPPSDAAEPAP